MVITIFRSRLRNENAEEFHELADRMMKLAEAMPGFISYKVYTSEDGERCSIVEFESHHQLLAWRNLAEHREAQQTGRERCYEEYALHVTNPIRESHFRRGFPRFKSKSRSRAFATLPARATRSPLMPGRRSVDRRTSDKIEARKTT